MIDITMQFEGIPKKGAPHEIIVAIEKGINGNEDNEGVVEFFTDQTRKRYQHTIHVVLHRKLKKDNNLMTLSDAMDGMKYYHYDNVRQETEWISIYLDGEEKYQAGLLSTNLDTILSELNTVVNSRLTGANIKYRYVDLINHAEYNKFLKFNDCSYGATIDKYSGSLRIYKTIKYDVGDDLYVVNNTLEWSSSTSYSQSARSGFRMLLARSGNLVYALTTMYHMKVAEVLCILEDEGIRNIMIEVANEYEIENFLSNKREGKYLYRITRSIIVDAKVSNASVEISQVVYNTETTPLVVDRYSDYISIFKNIVNRKLPKLLDNEISLGVTAKLIEMDTGFTVETFEFKE